MPVNRANLTILFFAIICLSGCDKQLDQKEYAEYVSDPDNGLRKDQTIGDFQLSVMYEPTEYILSMEKPENQDKMREDLQGFARFQFRINLTSGGNILQYNETYEQNEVTRIHHFSFEASEDFDLVMGSDTSRCAMAHFSRNYNVAPTVDISLMFEDVDYNNDWQLVYTDRQFNLGRTKFKFNEDDINDLPAFKL